MNDFNKENECLQDCKFCNGCDDEQCQCFENDENDLMVTKLEFIDEVLENFGNISFVTDYETSKLIALEYGTEDYDYMGLDLQSDNYLYLVDITPDEVFVIEPLKRTNGYYHIECEELIIDGEIVDELEEEFFEFVNAEISVISFVDEDDCDCNEEFDEEVNELIDCVLEDIENGECPKCSLISLYKLAFEDGRNSL